MVTPHLELSSVLDALEGAAFLFDREGRFLSANATACCLLGVREDQLTGRTLLDIRGLFREAESRHWSNLELMREERSERGQLQHYHVGGRDISLLVDRTVLRAGNGEVAGLLVRTVPVEGSKSPSPDSVRALRDVEQRYRALLQACPDMIFRIRADGVFLDFWAPGETYVPKEQIIGSRFADLLPADVVALTEPTIQQVLRDGIARDFEYSSQMPDLRIYSARISPNGPNEVFAYIRDITSQRRLEESKTLQAELAEFREAVHQASALGSERDVLQQVCNTAARHLHSVVARTWLLDPDGDTMVLQADSDGLEHSPVDQQSIALSSGWFGPLQSSTASRFVKNQAPEPMREWAERNGIVCMASFPLRAGDQLIGVLGVCFRAKPEPAVLDAVEQAAGSLAQIIARARTSRELAETAARLSAIFDNEPACVKVLSLQGEILSMNHAGLRIIGAPSVAAVAGQNALFLVEGHDRQRFLEYHMRVSQGATESIQFGLLSLEGQHLILDSISTPLRNADGRITAIISVTRDITEQCHSEQRRRELEKALRISEERYRLALEGSASGLWDWPDCSASEFFWSSQTHQLLGYEDGELPSRIHREEVLSLLVHPDQIETCRSALKKLGGEERFDLELRLRRKDGEYRWFRVLGLLHHGGPEGATRITGSIQDIHARKSAEDEIRRLNQELEARVRERTAELIAANRDLESFSYSVSHDLRAPIRAIEGFSRALAEDYGAGLDEPAHNFLQHIRRATARMSSLIDHMLRLAQYTRVQPQRSLVDLSGMVASIASELSSSNPSRSARFTIAAGVTVQADENLLRILVSNLLSNAWKFTSHVDGAHIEFGVLPQSDERVFYVRDNGAGFDPAYSEKLFQPFQRLHTMAEFPGTGVGLATAYRIVTKHNGRIWGESTPGNGATFYFTLKESAQATDPETARGQAAAS